MAKNFRKIPEAVLERIRTFGQDDIVVACVRLLRPGDIPQYAHLGLGLTDGNLTVPQPAVPPAAAGRFSRANVEGLEKVRRDLPKELRTFEFEAPDWGDWTNGSHTVSWTREVYRREFFPPKEVELSVTLTGQRDGGFLVKFAIEQVINRRTPNFEQELFYNMNLLQENVGAAEVFESATTLEEYAATVRVAWQILPPGTVDEVLRRMLENHREVTVQQQTVMRDRVAALVGLRPQSFITGTDGFLRYFGAKFGGDFVVFENVRYGNALYVMYDSWEELSRKSRVEVLSGPRDSFFRIPHTDGWRERLEAKVVAYRAR